MNCKSKIPADIKSLKEVTDDILKSILLSFLQKMDINIKSMLSTDSS